MSSSDTWLAVHSGDVNLKGSNVGHEEGQSPPMENLREDNITGDLNSHIPSDLSPW